MRIFDMCFFVQAMVLSFPGYLLDEAWTERTVLFESIPRLFASGFPGAVFLSEKPMLPSLARRNPVVVQFSQ